MSVPRKIVALTAVAVITVAAVLLIVLRGDTPEDAADLPAGQIADVDGRRVHARDFRAFEQALLDADGGRDKVLAVCRKTDDKSVRECRRARENLRGTVARQVVGNAQLLAEAQRRGWTVTDEQLRRQKHDHLVKHLKEPHRTQWLKLLVLGNRLTKEIWDKPVKVDPADVFRLYQERKEAFNRPERRSIRAIVVRSKRTAQKVAGRLKSGEDFAQLVVKYNASNPRALATGGRYENLLRSSLPAPLGDAVFAAELGPRIRGLPRQAPPAFRPGPVNGPVAGKPREWWVFQVVQIIPATKITYKQAYPQLKAELERRVRGLRGIRADQRWKARWRARTVCSEQMLSELCRNGPKPLKPPAS